MIPFIIVFIIFVIIPVLLPNKKVCDFCGSKNLIESENYGRSHEETWYYCSDCETFQD
jgi:hypothetical protein